MLPLRDTWCIWIETWLRFFIFWPLYFLFLFQRPEEGGLFPDYFRWTCWRIKNEKKEDECGDVTAIFSSPLPLGRGLCLGACVLVGSQPCAFSQIGRWHRAKASGPLQHFHGDSLTFVLAQCSWPPAAQPHSTVPTRCTQDFVSALRLRGIRTDQLLAN